jgi:Holliday junction resolvase RusA-like endonuclease
MDILAVIIPGTPVPQGSKNAYLRGGRIVLVESAKNLKSYRAEVSAAVSSAATEVGFRKVTRPGAVHIHISFSFVKPKSNRNKEHIVKPDIDKLSRTILDAITKSGLVYEDDSQVTMLTATKQYSGSAETLIVVKNATT